MKLFGDKKKSRLSVEFYSACIFEKGNAPESNNNKKNDKSSKEIGKWEFICSSLE